MNSIIKSSIQQAALFIYDLWELGVFIMSVFALFFGETLSINTLHILTKHHHISWTMADIINTIADKGIRDDPIVLIGLSEINISQIKAKALLNELRQDKHLNRDSVHRIIGKYKDDKQRFNHITNDRQSNHRPEVTKSVVDSVNALKLRYPVNVSFQDTQKSMREYTELHVTDTQIKTDLETFYTRLDTDSVHASLNMTLKECLSLVWQATHDPTPSANPDNITLSQNDIHDRVTSLLHECQRIVAYTCASELDGSTQNLCFSGMFNDLIATLNKAHSDVVINACAHHDIIPGALNEWIHNAMAKTDPHLAQQVISEWDQQDSDVRDDWIKAHQQSCKEFLYKEFGTLFDTSVIDSYCDSTIIADLKAPSYKPAMTMR